MPNENATTEVLTVQENRSFLSEARRCEPVYSINSQVQSRAGMVTGTVTL